MFWIVRVTTNGGIHLAAEWKTIGEAIEYVLSQMNGRLPALEITITRYGETDAE